MSIGVGEGMEGADTVFLKKEMSLSRLTLLFLSEGRNNEMKESK